MWFDCHAIRTALLFGFSLALAIASSGCEKKSAGSTSGSEEVQSFDSSGWRIWRKNAEPNWKGELFGTSYLASDPSVIRDGSIFRMYYTCLATADDPADNGGFSAGICQVKSADGVNWSFGVSIDPNFKGVVLKGNANAWDTHLETSSIIKDGSTYRLFYSGYKTPTDANDTRPASAVGMASSSDGDVFTKANGAVINPTAQGYDADDMFSPVAFFVGGLLRMIYVGWCIDGTYANHDGLTCDHGAAIQLLGATRNTNGSWSKQVSPVISPTANPPWLRHGAAEPGVLVGPDGYIYLFITGGLGDDEPRVTGIARSRSTFDTWEISPEPILKPDGRRGRFDSCGTFAPSVILEQNVVKMWYLGLDDCDGTCSSCDFKACGCETKFGIGYAEAKWPLHAD
ncbi:MAG: hypothetical protein AB7G93_19735 [Bdellovibrionales bacterium]